jgi:OFA family oxalate/formate antiporter-like MFS transporter
MSVNQAAAGAPPVNRWVQLVVGVICMVMIANLQYGWSFFVAPMSEAHGWSRAAIQWAFFIFVFTETWLVPVEGWFVDKLGPRIVVMFGAILVAIAWVINSVATTLPVLYFAAIVAGIGAGCVYGTCVGNALKWFADRRGLAAGLTAAGFGAGAAITTVPIIYTIDVFGYQSAFFWFGLGQGAIILLLSPLLKAPLPGQVPLSTKKKVIQTTRDFKPMEVLKAPLFWVLYVMFTLVAAGGMMATAQFALIAADWGVANVVVFGIASTLVVANIVDNILNGVARPFFGWVSDQIGREITMFMVFSAGALCLLGAAAFGPNNPVMFVIFFGLIFFTWGEIYSLFPATCTDSFGSKYAATNAGMLYTAKGTATFFAAPLAVLLMNSTGSWDAVFWTAAIMDVVAAVMAILVLKPMRMAHRAAFAIPSPAAPQAAE